MITTKRVRLEGFYMKYSGGIKWWQYYRMIERRYYFLGFHVWSKYLAKADRPWHSVIR